MINPKDYDGFYFLPGENEYEMKFTYFEVTDKENHGEPIKGNSVGDIFHIAFFGEDENGLPMFKQEFEAVIGDPGGYIKNLIGHKMYGCMLRKTDNSEKWWSDYMQRTKGHCDELKKYTESLIEANTKVAQ